MLKLALISLLLLAQPENFRPNNDLFKVNNGHPLLDAHNCYPNDGKWSDRIDRALQTGYPVGIEQDIAPYTDPQTGKVTAKVTHREQGAASDPSLRDHFFERVRPQIEKALKDKKKNTWPLIVLHFDFKNNSVPTLEAVWSLLGEYRPWITTAKKTGNDNDLAAFDWKPILVLTEDNDTQEEVFYRRLAAGDRLLLFGSAHTNEKIFAGLDKKQQNHALANAAPELLLPTRATNYRRWWNNSWYSVEENGQQHAGDWTSADDLRLKALVDHTHRQGYWIRFFTLDGFAPGTDKGWGATYNFGSVAEVQKRWKASLAAGVDMIATDQYEDLRTFMQNP
jgi:hypothetical protein